MLNNIIASTAGFVLSILIHVSPMMNCCHIHCCKTKTLCINKDFAPF